MDMNAADVLTYIRQHPEEIAEALRREHRTHQQSTAGSIAKILHSYSEHGTDIRNEASVQWAKSVASEIPYFPFM